MTVFLVACKGLSWLLVALCVCALLLANFAPRYSVTPGAGCAYLMATWDRELWEKSDAWGAADIRRCAGYLWELSEDPSNYWPRENPDAGTLDG